MKNIKITILFLLIGQFAFSQFNLRFNNKEYFTVSTIADVGASFKENGLDIGAEVEYVGAIYANARIENFSALEGGYFAVGAAIGISLTSGHFERVRYYSGVRGYRVLRNGAWNANIGFEAGIDWMPFDEGVFFGVRFAIDNRQDMIALSNPVIWRENGYVRIGYKWDWK